MGAPWAAGPARRARPPQLGAWCPLVATGSTHPAGRPGVWGSAWGPTCWRVWGPLWGLNPNPTRRLALHLQLFNIYPGLGALLQLHRPVLRKIEAVRAILRTLLEAWQPPTPSGGPVKSYVDALIQQGQVWARPILPPKRPGASGGPTPGGAGLGGVPCCSCTTSSTS